MKGICVAFLSLMIVTSSIQAQRKSDYLEMLNELLEVTGSTATTDLFMVKLIEAAKMEYPDVEEDDWKNLELVVHKSRLEYREKKLVPLYQKSVSYTHLRAHETVLDLVCRLLLEKKQIPLHITLELVSS